MHKDNSALFEMRRIFVLCRGLESQPNLNLEVFGRFNH